MIYPRTCCPKSITTEEETEVIWKLLQNNLVSSIRRVHLSIDIGVGSVHLGTNLHLYKTGFLHFKRLKFRKPNKIGFLNRFSFAKID